MNTPWQDPIVGGVYKISLSPWIWDICLDVGSDPAPANWYNPGRGAPSYDQECGMAFTQPLGAGLNMSFIETEFRLPEWSFLHPTGAPMGFGFSYDYFCDVASGGAVNACLFWAYKIVPDGTDGATVAWNVVSGLVAGATFAANVRYYSPAATLSPAGLVNGGIMRLRFGRRALDGATADTYANQVVFTGSDAYIVSN